MSFKSCKKCIPSNLRCNICIDYILTPAGCSHYKISHHKITVKELNFSAKTLWVASSVIRYPQAELSLTILKKVGTLLAVAFVCKLFEHLEWKERQITVYLIFSISLTIAFSNFSCHFWFILFYGHSSTDIDRIFFIRRS